MSTPAHPLEMQLPFPHGIEIELQVIKRDGSWIRGEEILQIFDKLVSNAKGFLDKRIRASGVASVKHKYNHSSQTEEGERGSRVVVSYMDPQGSFKEYTLLGHDPNVTSLTWILEVATPPCTTLEELAWWTQTLIAMSYESLPKETQVILVSTGLNPTQEYLKALSFGEHHHILGPTVSEQARLSAYNIIRNFIPHLIALSVNSPFENKAATDEVTIDEKGRTRAPKCKRSIRLARNTTQMGPTNEFEFIPHLTKTDKEGFARHVNRSYARMVDVYPFTRFDTIEIRVCDTQLSISRHIGIALLLQALALKAKRMTESGEAVPDVGAKSLALNREAAVNAGLWAPFHPASANEDSTFLRIYNHAIGDTGEILEKTRNRFMGDAIVSMLYLIRDEIEELRLIDNPFLQPILVSIFGSELWEARTTGADFQLDVYAKSDQNMVVLLRKLADITRECCTNWLYDPLESTPRLPMWLHWWTGIEPEIVVGPDRVFAGDDASFTISIKNTSGKSLSNLNVPYTIEDSGRNIIQQNAIMIPSLDAGEIHISHVSFQTKVGTTAYNIIVRIQIAGREINVSNTINTYWIRMSVRPSSTTQFADGKTPMLFTSEIETNYPKARESTCKVSVLSPAMEGILADVSEAVSIDAKQILSLDNDDFPPLVIPSGVSEGVERCMLKIALTDEDGKEYASALSRPFYVGFRARGATVQLTATAKPVHNPGDLVSIGVQLNVRGEGATPGAIVSVVFRADSGVTHGISDLPISSLVEGKANIVWSVPLLISSEAKDHAGLIQATLYEGPNRVASADSAHFTITSPGFTMQIDSMRVMERTSIGGKISGWLRIRRSQEEGDPAELVMTLRFGEDDEHVLLKQQLRSNRNLSLAYGPLVIPKPKSTSSPTSAELIAELVSSGITLDRRTARIAVTAGEDRGRVGITFTGVPNYVNPDEAATAVINVNNEESSSLEGILRVSIESVAGNEPLLEKEISVAADDNKMVSVPFRVPIGAEMSTAYLVGVFEMTGQSVESRYRFKIKAIEKPMFELSFSIKNSKGEEIPGLVPRASRVTIDVVAKLPRTNMRDLDIRLRVLSRRETVEEFDLRIINPESTEQTFTLEWTTPQVELVTAHYLDALILHRGRPLPQRAISMSTKQFTVY